MADLTLNGGADTDTLTATNITVNGCGERQYKRERPTLANMSTRPGKKPGSDAFNVQPATILRWHRQAFQLLWRRKSKRAAVPRRITADTLALIETMATNNRLWGAERIRGELLKLDLGIAFQQHGSVLTL
jgi:hypothetical protein